MRAEHVASRVCRSIMKLPLSLRESLQALEEVHMAARGDRQETREELDSLLNLMARLDFNHFFSEPPEISTLLGSPL